MRFSSRTGLVHLTAVVALCAALVPAAAFGSPKSPSFGRMIDAYPTYQGQTKCDPTAKPGVVSFQSLVLAAYPWTSSLGITRACSIGGTSEHKEGRAWDWGVRAGSERDRAAADDLFTWLMGRDRYGNRVARARRIGIMYLIWNRRIWFPSSGWRVYCVQEGRYCRDPDDGGIKNPHIDHVHFSFNRSGAMKRRTFWHADRSLVTDMESNADGSGYWMAGHNGGIATFAAVDNHGDKSNVFLSRPVVDMTPRPTNAGYWMLQRSGRVVPFGDAPRLGSISDSSLSFVGMSATPSGKGYWLTTTKGHVFGFGDASVYGDKVNSNATITTIAATPGGAGYWLVGRAGFVYAFGDARGYGGLGTESVTIAGIAPTPTGKGYWLATTSGRVAAFGDAESFGDLTGETVAQPIVAIEAAPTGNGYWLVDRYGKTRAFGEATVLSPSRQAPASTPWTSVLSQIEE